MSVRGLKVAIAGGSIAGCAAATALIRAGCNVEVFERSASGLIDRGSGIGIPGTLRDTLIEKAYLPKDYPNCAMARRWWQFPDGTKDGRLLCAQPAPAFANNWGNLWSALRNLVPNEVYHEGKSLASFEESPDGVDVRFADGEERRFDLLVGAEGYKSLVRSALHPSASPQYAGYVLWRGNYPETELSDHHFIDALDAETAWVTVPFPGGHSVLYMIPDFDGGNTPGRRRVNWGVYGPTPQGQPLDGIESIPPGKVTDATYGELQNMLQDHFPPAVRDLIAHSPQEEVSIQPIYDSVVDSFVGERTLLIGDAATMTRPHTASGATKALEDALALESLAMSCASLPDLLREYDELRCEGAKVLAEIGRRIGKAQVINTPNWGAMGPTDFATWTKAILAGDKLYIYGEDE
eukprot:m.27211 g.27211  ORF g.27211 m.27211 type:complete len:408 (+) comp7876_c0_seq1:288-1511(+)